MIEIVYRLWYGPLRRIARPVLRRLCSPTHVHLGPLRGCSLVVPGHAYALGIVELPVQQALRQLLRPGDVVYDVGANIGYLSLVAARAVGPSGHVYAFEPLADNVVALTQLLVRNGLHNWSLSHCAVAHKTVTASLFLSTSNSTPSLVPRVGAPTVTVETTTLDTVRREHRAPTVIKVDVEGAEGLVLCGATDLLRAAAATWIIEVHDATNEAAVSALLRDAGYAPRALARRRHRPFPYHLVAVSPHRDRLEFS